MALDTLHKAALQETLSVRLTLDGVSNLIMDYVTRYGSKPKAIVLSYRDRRSLNQDTMGASIAPVAMSDQNKDDMCVAYVQGVMVGWNRNLPDGKAIIIPEDQHKALAV